MVMVGRGRRFWSTRAASVVPWESPRRGDEGHAGMRRMESMKKDREWVTLVVAVDIHLARL
jgi:predicted small integral membrane protein